MSAGPLLAAASLASCVPANALCGDGDVLLLAPHPDDETLGCGAAVAALSAAGRRVQVVAVTDGAASHPRSRSHPPARLARVRRDELAAAVAILTEGRGPSPVWLGYPDLAAPDGAAAAQAAAERIAEFAPLGAGAIWAAWEGDPHPDHGRTARIAACLHAMAPQLARWSYPIWGRFARDAPAVAPDRIVRFHAPERRETKARALAAHRTQMTRSIDDDPGGFRMQQSMQAHFIETPEIFLREPR